jgi:hypothetical protein
MVAFLMPLVVFSQSNEAHVNFSLFIDNKFIVEGVYNGRILIKSNAGDTLDSLTFYYEAGDIRLSAEDYNKIVGIDRSVNSVIKFSYRQFCPSFSEFHYEYDWQGSLLSNRFIIFKVFNYSSEVNRNLFLLKSGYGIEISTPGSGTILPRKKQKKNNQNSDCS